MIDIYEFSLNIKGKRILYVATKNLDYIRCNQEINLIKEYSYEYRIIGSNNKNYLLRTIFVYAKFLVLLFTYKPEIIFVGFAAQLLFPFYIFNFFTRKAVIITDFFVSLFDTMVNDRKKINENSFFAKLCHKIDQTICSKSTLIITDTKAHASYFQKEFIQSGEKFAVIYLEPDKLLYTPKSILRPKKLDSKFIVLYFGSYLPLQGVDVILETSKKLVGIKKVHFILIGPITKLKIISAQFPNITFINWLSQDELANNIAMADLCLAGHFNSSICKAKRTIPGKAYIYQAMKKPMILGDNLANHEIFSEKESNDIYFVPMGDPQSLADLITKIYEKKVIYENK